MRSDAVCRSCGAPIRWAQSATTGKRIPLDHLAVTGGNLQVVDAINRDTPMPTPVVAINPTKPLTAYHYTSHFATCLDADLHRKKR